MISRGYKSAEIATSHRERVFPAAEATHEFLLDMTNAMRRAMEHAVTQAPRLHRSGAHLSRVLRGEYDLVFPKLFIREVRMEDTFEFPEITECEPVVTAFSVEHIRSRPGHPHEHEHGTSRITRRASEIIVASPLCLGSLYADAGIGSHQPDIFNATSYGSVQDLLDDNTDAFMNRIVSAMDISRMVLHVCGQKGYSDTYKPDETATNLVEAWRNVSQPVADGIWEPYQAELIAARTS